jgi:uroporphyrin-III C-methyltransferase
MDQKKGRVIIIGAGPGDPELLTVKATRYLRQAEVVLADRLVSPEIFKEYLAPDAELIAVGKQCRKGASTPQYLINELMVRHAAEGKLVVRLKGGDVSIFSNVLDELETLVAHGIAYELVPGVTAALGAAAYSGIPLTARGHATAVGFLTDYRSDVVTDDYWKELAATEDTLVFYMSAETLPHLVAKLTENRIAPEKLLAVVEQVTTPNQQVTVFDLYRFKEQFKRNPVSPSLIIIGRVVGLHQQFAWVANGLSREEYFQPVAAKLFGYEEEQLKLLTA